MQLPNYLQLAIEHELDHTGRGHIAKAREELTDRYRNRTGAAPNQPFMSEKEHRLSYLATRLPATFGAVTSVLKELHRRLPNLEINSLLDLGAGPGTAALAAAEIFEELNEITLIENDEDLINIGKRLAAASAYPSLQEATWMTADLNEPTSIPRHDLTILSYSIGELSEEARLSLITRCWESTNNLLIIIEPGTPVGFERIRSIRTALIEKGAHMVAPCPHTNTCPMANGDWCHFSARIERSSFHRNIKGGSLGFEDEKFSYLILSKSECPQPEARVLRHPLKRSGHMHLTLCERDGLKERIVSKRDGELYKEARKLEWGMSFDFRPREEV